MKLNLNLNLSRTRPLVIALVVLSLFLSACAAASIISYINQGLQIALEFLPLAVPGLPPAVTGYFQAGLSCVDFAATEVATGDSNAIKSAKITAECASLVKADMPPGTPANIVALASRLATKIADILAHLPAVPAPASTTAKAVKPTFMKLHASDTAQLHSIAARAKAAKLQLAAKTDPARKP